MKKIIALTFVAATLLLAGCCTTHQVAHWEYRTSYSIGEVNDLAAEGWVVSGFTKYNSSSTPDGSGTTNYGVSDTFLLKRPKQ